jgi:hypothetical protein
MAYINRPGSLVESNSATDKKTVRANEKEKQWERGQLTWFPSLSAFSMKTALACETMPVD